MPKNGITLCLGLPKTAAQALPAGHHAILELPKHQNLSGPLSGLILTVLLATHSPLAMAASAVMFSYAASLSTIFKTSTPSITNKWGLP